MQINKDEAKGLTYEELIALGVGTRVCVIYDKEHWKNIYGEDVFDGIETLIIDEFFMDYDLMDSKGRHLGSLRNSIYYGTIKIFSVEEQ